MDSTEYIGFLDIKKMPQLQIFMKLEQFEVGLPLQKPKMVI